MEEKNNVRVNNTPSIEYTLRPITYTSWLLGAGVARPRKYSKDIMIIIRIVHLIACTANMVYVAKEYSNLGSVFALENDIFDFIHIMNIVIFHVSAYYNIYHGIRHYEKWPELMDRIKELDQKFKRQITINDRPVRNMEALAILTTFIWCPLALIIHVLYYYFTNPKNINVSSFLLSYVIAQSLINSFVFDVVVYTLYYRLKTINKLIAQLNESSSDPSWVTLKIRCIRELYTGICHVISMVNDLYGLYLLLCSMNCFVMVVAVLNIIYICIVEKNDPYILINNIIWILHVMQFGLMCWICTLARQESAKIGRSVYEVVFNCKPVNLGKLNGTRNQSSLETYPLFEGSGRKQISSSGHNVNYIASENFSRRNLDRDCVMKEINDFSIQLQHSQVAFTACDFFEINNALFSGFVGMIITYLVISIQFYQRPEKRSVVERLFKIF